MTAFQKTYRRITLLQTYSIYWRALRAIPSMEKPDSFTADDIHKAQQQVLEELRPITADSLRDSLILGQYEGYQQEPKVDPASKTETFACLQIHDVQNLMNDILLFTVIRHFFRNRRVEHRISVERLIFFRIS